MASQQPMTLTRPTTARVTLTGRERRALAAAPLVGRHADPVSTAPHPMHRETCAFWSAYPDAPPQTCHDAACTYTARHAAEVR